MAHTQQATPARRLRCDRTLQGAAVALVVSMVVTTARPQAVTNPATTTQSATARSGLPATTTAASRPLERAAQLKAAFALETQAYTTQTQADYKVAAEALEECSAVEPNDLHLERSVGYLWLEKLDDAAKAYPHLEKAYSLSPEDPGWGYLLAKAAGALDKNDRQIAVLKEILKRNPDDSVSKNALAEALKVSAPATAPATSQAATTTLSAPPDPHQAMIDAALALETKAYTTQDKADFQAAADALEKCSHLTTNDDIERSVGYIWLDKLKTPAKAYPHLEKVYRNAPGDPGWGSLLAKASGQLGDINRQLQVLRDVVNHNPENSGSRLELAQALDKAGQHDQAGNEFRLGLKQAPDDEALLAAYGQYLHARGRNIEAGQLAEKVLEKNPNSPAALALKGDLHRDDWNLTDAQAAYEQALAQDPESEVAKTGMNEIRHSRAPTFDSNYYYFLGSDHFMQQGLYNTISVSASDHVYLNATYNMGYFKDDRATYPSVVRYQEGVGIEDRVASSVSIRGGIGGFQMRGKEASGFNLGVTWKPTNELWIDASYRTDDPVNDSMFTVANGLSQDILGFTGGYQFNDDLALKVAASRSSYSDDNVRQFIHVEPAYTIWQTEKIRIGAEYETVRYSKQIPGAGGLNWYQTFGPVIEAEPPITSWLSGHVRLEVPYVPSAVKWGTNVNVDFTIHPGDHLTLKAGAFYVAVPESISSYSGSGFDASLSYRF